jgi:Icc-related predicted phosphoesterase
MADMKIFFATDLHGSDAAFRKFLNAAQVYKPDVMILGGDMTGRQVVPFIKFANGKAAFTWQGKDITAEQSQ